MAGRLRYELVLVRLREPVRHILKTAKAMGLNLSDSFLLIADEVIE